MTGASEENKQTETNKACAGIQESAQKNLKPFVFSGCASEYFSIWVVNVVLTIITLGLYGPWAKVRTNQYFYSNTRVDNSAFQYLADPKKILKGRMIATVIFLAYYSAGMIESSLSLVVTVVILLMIPFLLVNAMSFQLRNSAYRNVRFDFHKNYIGAYKIFILPVLLIGMFSVLNILLMPESLKKQNNEVDYTEDVTIEQDIDEAYYENTGEEVYYDSNGLEIEDAAQNEALLNEPDENAVTEEEFEVADDLKLYLALQAIFIIVMTLLWPCWDYLFCRFRSEHARFGMESFNFLAKARGFYAFYAKGILISLLGLAIIGIVIGLFGSQFKDTIQASASVETIKQVAIVSMFLFMMGFYLWFFAYFQTKRTNIVYNNLKLRGHHLQCEIKVSYLFFLYLSNSLAMALSLGLLMPWAKIRTARYRAEVTSLLAEGDLGNFTAAQKKDQTALGEELGNLFDMDLGV